MKKLLLLLFAAGSINAMAQPTFTNSTIPTIGQVLTTQVYDSVGVSAGPAGANQTWTFTLTPTMTFTQTIVAPSSTPYASLYPNANLASDDGSGSYSYQQASATDVRIWGLYTPAYQLTYTDPMIYYSLPMSFMDTYSDNFAGSYVYGGGAVTAQRTGTHTVTYDAYGTLVLNGQTFTNVIRLHSYETYQDVTSFSTTNSTSDTYNWYGNSGANLLLQINWISADFGGGQVINTKSVTGMANPSSVENAGVSSLSFDVLGNVCSSGDNVLISIGADRSETISLELVDALGRRVAFQSAAVSPGHNGFTLSTNGLAGGLYLVRLTGANGTSANTQKLMVQ